MNSEIGGHFTVPPRDIRSTLSRSVKIKRGARREADCIIQSLYSENENACSLQTQDENFKNQQ